MTALPPPALRATSPAARGRIRFIPPREAGRVPRASEARGAREVNP